MRCIYRNGVRYYLNDRERQEIYESVKSDFLLKDARRHLGRYFNIDVDMALTSQKAAMVHFKQRTGVDFINATSASHRSYMLSGIVERFLHDQSSSVADNTTWQNAIAYYLDSIGV